MGSVVLNLKGKTLDEILSGSTFITDNIIELAKGIERTLVKPNFKMNVTLSSMYKTYGYLSDKKKNKSVLYEERLFLPRDYKNRHSAYSIDWDSGEIISFPDIEKRREKLLSYLGVRGIFDSSLSTRNTYYKEVILPFMEMTGIMVMNPRNLVGDNVEMLDSYLSSEPHYVDYCNMCETSDFINIGHLVWYVNNYLKENHSIWVKPHVRKGREVKGYYKVPSKINI